MPSSHPVPASFAASNDVVGTGPRGQLAHRLQIEHAQRLTERCWTVAPGVGEVRRESLGPLAPGMLRVRTLYTGISRGTESLVFQGEVPASEFGRMRAPFQFGDCYCALQYR